MDKGILDEHGLKAEFLGAQPGKAFLVDKGLKGVEVGDQDVDPHVELIAIEEEGINDVLLDDDVVGVVELG